MDFRKKVVEGFWDCFDKRDFSKAKEFLHKDFVANWVTSEESFDKDSFIEMNANYPGKWFTKVKRLDLLNDGAVSIVHVFSDKSDSEFFVTTFYEFNDELIYKIEEYWAEKEVSPEWRKKYVR
jgi:hypothetical protein